MNVGEDRVVLRHRNVDFLVLNGRLSLVLALQVLLLCRVDISLINVGSLVWVLSNLGFVSITLSQKKTEHSPLPVPDQLPA